MDLDFTLRVKTPSEWWPHVERNFDEFLLDHASCERKASAVGIQFVCKYPEKSYLIDSMLSFAREELQHFHQVMRLVLKKGLRPNGDSKDPYINELLKGMRTSPQERFLDRLLIFGLVEKRGTEKFKIVAENHQDSELKQFYKKLSEAEARHHELFLTTALHEFDRTTVEKRMHYFEDLESKIVQELPIRAAVH